MTLVNLFRTSAASAIAAAGLVTLVAAPAQAGDKAAPLTAAQMMKRAHEARAEWENFPGFAADVSVSRDGKRVAGKLTVTADLEVELQLPDEAEAKWAERSLKSLVSHRNASEGREYNVEFADDETDHPLGRLIDLNDELMGSVYRIKGDVITEVHRKMGESRFTISVTDVSRNKEGKYLPRSYSFSTWDVKTGNLKSNTAVRNAWKRVGKFDLPKRLLWIETGDEGEREVRQIVFAKHRLLSAKTAAK